MAAINKSYIHSFVGFMSNLSETSGRYNGIAFSIKFSLSCLKQFMLSEKLTNSRVRYLLQNYWDLYCCKTALLLSNNVMTAAVYA